MTKEEELAGREEKEKDDRQQLFNLFQELAKVDKVELGKGGQEVIKCEQGTYLLVQGRCGQGNAFLSGWTM